MKKIIKINMKDNQLKLIFVILAFSFCLNAKGQIPNWQ